MEKITITYDKVGNTLDIWFSKPRPCINEEIGNGIILKKDEKGEVIGFEKIKNEIIPQGGNLIFVLKVR